MRSPRWWPGVIFLVLLATGCDMPWYRILDVVDPWSAPARPAAAPAPLPSPAPSTAGAHPGVTPPGCTYGQHGNAWIECGASQTSGQVVEVFWTVNGRVVASYRTNAVQLVFSYRPRATGTYVIGLSVRFADGSWGEGTTTLAVSSLNRADADDAEEASQASEAAEAGTGGGTPMDPLDDGDGAAGAADDCDGVFLLGVCAPPDDGP
jgi:hypothetical protein